MSVSHAVVVRSRKSAVDCVWEIFSLFTVIVVSGAEISLGKVLHIALGNVAADYIIFAALRGTLSALLTDSLLAGVPGTFQGHLRDQVPGR